MEWEKEDIYTQHNNTFSPGILLQTEFVDSDQVVNGLRLEKKKS